MRMEKIVEAKAPPRIWAGPLFLATILTGSFLLFLVQPMIARMALPRLGGAPAVWNSAMLVYQALLLGGYAYAHAIGRLKPRGQAALHVTLFAVAALWLPIGLVAATPSATASPVVWVPWLLSVSIGPLFFVVAAQAPLMQRWYAISSGGRDPYALYAASNVGSFGGLIAYPLLVEPLMPLAAQSTLWTTGYILLALLMIGCALTLPRRAAVETVSVAPLSPAPTIGRRIHWILLAAVPSGLMLSTTTFLTTDIVAMPLLWAIPLGLYLLSFSIAFAGWRKPADVITRVAPVAILVLTALSLGGIGDNAFATAGFGAALLFVAAIALHTVMYRLRPAVDRLTGFYLYMSLGGVIGGIFAALIAPVVFDWTYEHPLLILAAGAMLPLMRTPKEAGQKSRILMLVALLGVLLLMLAGMNDALPAIAVSLGIAGLALFPFAGRAVQIAALAAILLVNGVLGHIAISAKSESRSRSYFGVYTVTNSVDGAVRQISHGTTLHGKQFRAKGRETAATSYYYPDSGVGRAALALPSLYGADARVGVVGLGAGTLACYAQPGQSWRFYEIDPEVARIASNPARFTFLSRCTPGAPIEIGDARLTLAAAPAAGLDLLVLDAFSSDSVPMHLLTLESFATYRRAIADDGLLLVHISNRYLDLEPVIAANAARGGWHAAVAAYHASTLAVKRDQATSSLWIALSPDKAKLDALTARAPKAWRPVQGRPGFTPWSDDYSTILPLLKL